MFSPAIFDCLECLIRTDVRSRREIQLTTAQQMLMNGVCGYYCYEVSGERYDTGVPFGLMEAQLALALSGTYRDEIIERCSPPAGKGNFVTARRVWRKTNFPTLFRYGASFKAEMAGYVFSTGNPQPLALYQVVRKPVISVEEFRL